MYRETEWRMRVLLSIVSAPGHHCEKQKPDGSIYHCKAVHFDGEGLVEVFRKATNDVDDISVQFSIYGQALAILQVEGERERLLFERDMCLGNREQADELALQILHELEPTITDQEAMAYYL